MRIMTEHHLALSNERLNHIGIINTQMKPKEVIEKWTEFVLSLAQTHYGKDFVPNFKLNGHISACFPYIQIPLDYILPELLMNAVR